MPSLSVLIGATSAVTVVVVAAVTLSIALTFSLEAIDTVGRGQAATLADLALLKLDVYITAPRNAVLSVSAYFQGGRKPFPSEDPTRATAEDLATFQRGAWRAAETASTCAAILRDGTFIITQRNPVSPALHMLQAVNILRPSGIDHYVTSTYIANGSNSPPNLLIGAAVPSQFTALYQPGAFFDYLASRVFVDDVRLDAWIAPPIILQFGTAPPFLQLSLHAAAYNGTNTSLGILASGVAADRLSSFLAESKSTAGSELFAIGPDLRVIGTTSELPWYSIQDNVPRNATLEPGCSSTITSTAAAPGTPVHWVCRRFLREHGYGPAKELATRGIPADGVYREKLDGERFYLTVASSKIERTFGYTLRLIAFLPEKDVVGEVDRGTAIAIGISALALVLAVAASCAIVIALLRPLDDVAEQMEFAASLQDVQADARESPSGIAEVRNLQMAFYSLTDELVRLRSFVPASVLAGRFSTDEDNETSATVTGSEPDGDDSSHRAVRTSARSSQHRGGGSQYRGSQRQLSSHRSGSKRSSGANGASAFGLNLVVGLTERVASVLVVNCAGFNDYARQRSLASLPQAYQHFIEGIARAVHQQLGVLEYFHGDRVLASFNASRHIAAHARRALSAAFAIAHDVLPSTLRLPVHVGVGSSRCRVGNLGIESSKRFCVLGPAVARADALCRLAREYANDTMRLTDLTFDKSGSVTFREVPSGSTVLISGTLAHEAELHYVIQTLDVRRVVASEKNVGVAAIVAQAVDDAGGAGASSGDSEWMYVIGKSSVETESVAGKAMLGLKQLAGGRVDDAVGLLEGGRALVARGATSETAAGKAARRLLDRLDAAIERVKLAAARPAAAPAVAEMSESDQATRPVVPGVVN